MVKQEYMPTSHKFLLGADILIAINNYNSKGKINVEKNQSFLHNKVGR
jgi:hypothetical protein